MSRSTFSRRLAHGQSLEKLVDDHLSRLGLPYWRQGLESLTTDNLKKIKRALEQSDDPGATALRYRPDFGVLVDGRVVELEAKNGRIIERSAYEAYLAQEAAGKEIRLLFRDQDRIVACRPSEVVLTPGDEENRLRLPCDKNWRQPRLYERWEHIKGWWPGSGDDCGLVDLEATPTKLFCRLPMA